MSEKQDVINMNFLNVTILKETQRKYETIYDTEGHKDSIIQGILLFSNKIKNGSKVTFQF